MRLRATAAAVLVVLAACGGGGGGGDGEEAASSTTVEREEAMLAFAACMREEGIDYPDPGPDGEVDVTFEAGDADAWEAAEAACGELRPEMAPMPEVQQAELSDQLLAQAACMRDLGWDIPDPQITTPADGGVQFLFPERLDIDVDDPEYQEDHRTCVEETGLDEGALTGGGGFGG